MIDDNKPVSIAHACLSPEQKRSLLQRYESLASVPDMSYGTVEDFCDSWDYLPCLTNIQGDLKDLQRPAAVKLLLKCLKPGAKILEIGAGEPYVASVLSQLGFSVTVVDPYDGSGNGPTEYEKYIDAYPDVRMIRSVFSDRLPDLRAAELDAIYSISVLEHVADAGLSSIFRGVTRFLKSGGYSIHLVDHVLSGETSVYHLRQLAQVFGLQSELAGESAGQAAFDLASVLQALACDGDTYYLSAEGHNKWRGTMSYASFPFRRVVSVHSIKRKARE